MNICLLASWVKRYILDGSKLQKQVIEYKYMVDNPNIFYCSSTGTSPFWEGVVWAIKAAKMGYQWKVGVVGGLSFGKTIGLRLVVWPSNTRRFITSLMSKIALYLSCGMGSSLKLPLGDALTIGLCSNGMEQFILLGLFKLLKIVTPYVDVGA
jgi:hypothetical protein